MWVWGSGGRPVQGFYVHPKTGLLQEASRMRYVSRAKREPREVVRVQVGDSRLFERFDGLWFETAYRRFDDGARRRVLKRQCASKLVRRIEGWIREADRGRRGYRRGVESVHAPGSFDETGPYFTSAAIPEPLVWAGPGLAPCGSETAPERGRNRVP